MASVHPIGVPVNESEREAIAFLRDNLPGGYFILHNFEIARNGELFEIDIAIVAPHAVYLVDVKGTRGVIDVYGSKWHPQGRQPFTSPLPKLRSHAKTVKGIIVDSQPARTDLEGIYVDAAVILTSPDASLVDASGRDSDKVTSLKKAAAFFQNSSRIPAGRSKNITALHTMVLKALKGIAKPRSGPQRFESWEVIERLGGTSAYTEYRAFNIYAGRHTTALLRVYQADPYLPPDEREAQKLRISNAFRTLSSMPSHQCVVGARDFFPNESGDNYILVTEDVPGQALRINIEKPNFALTFDQKIRIANDLLNSLVHLHCYKVVHRNITPSTILIGSDGRARLISFDFARAGADRSRTIADQIVDDLEPGYMAPEVHGEPVLASPASDIYSVGLVLYELFTGERAFANSNEIFEQKSVFPVKPSTHRPELPKGFDEWLQHFCSHDPDNRPSAILALSELEAILNPSKAEPIEIKPAEPAPIIPPEVAPIDYSQLQANDQLTSKYVVVKSLGKPGAFGVVYKVIDTLGDISRVVKLILRDRHSTLDRLKKEYRTLLRIPDHPNVVKVIDADILPSGGPPFIVFEYLDGLDVGEMIESKMFAPEDALDLGKQVIAGLVHLHQNGVYHCDIKPRNLLWTPKFIKIIDFNVSLMPALGNGHGGGSRRYLPPDLDLNSDLINSDHADRDLFALGLTLYEAVTGGRYPWEPAVIPQSDKPAKDLREFSNLIDLAPEFADAIQKAIAPKRAARFSSALEMQSALALVPAARRAMPIIDTSSSWTLGDLNQQGTFPPNTNPYVRDLQTLYSQSKRSNAGTRGLDAISEKLYVATALDQELLPTVLKGEFRLVVISGNAGDGKTAFLQKLEKSAEDEGASIDRSLPNGSRFELRKRKFISNYDGSQDEGNEINDKVLQQFFSPFIGDDISTWPNNETRLIAINEGRLIDFLETHKQDFIALSDIARRGLITGNPEQGIAIVNLNLRSVVTDPREQDNSIFERLIRLMAKEDFWKPCYACDLRDKCYVFHNAQTLQDETAGPKVIERLKTLYTITHLRGRLHITLRDLRSALAFMLVGTRDCDEIHELYNTGRREDIIQGFYFNSWMGGDGGNADRLLTLLRDVDIASPDDPRLDRALDFVSPNDDKSLFRFDRRGNYDREVLKRLFDDLPRDYSGQLSSNRADAHRKFIGIARRRNFFERRDNGWQVMLPYKTADRMLSVIKGERLPGLLLNELLYAINRGEGLNRPERLDNNLALEVRRVEGGSIRSYRLYPKDRFSLQLKDEAVRARFVEHMPTGLVLHYNSDVGNNAELIVTLDIFEMLQRLNEGYRPSVEEEQGYYLSLAVFKNLLGSAPYQEVLLTTSGHDFYRVARQTDGRLEMSTV
ncbi:MAG: protein kinase [Acidobacteriota bacterium]